MEPTTPPRSAHRSDLSDDLARRLDTWVTEGLIARANADAIAAFEARRRPASAGPRVTPVAEGLAYLGAALAVAGGGTALGGWWNDLSVAAHVGIAAAIWLSLLVVGWRFRGGPSPALVRLSRVLWFLSAAALAWTARLVVDESLDIEGRWDPVATGGVTTVYAAALYLARPSTLQQLAVVLGVLLIATGFVEDATTAVGFAIWALGIAWLLLGWRRVLVEPPAAATIGSLLVILGVVFVATRDEEIGAWLAVVSSAGLIGAGVAIRHTAVMVIGTIALFFSTFATIEQYVEGSTGIALGLLVAGAVVSAVALGVWRLGRDSRTPTATGA